MGDLLRSKLNLEGPCRRWSNEPLGYNVNISEPRIVSLDNMLQGLEMRGYRTESKNHVSGVELTINVNKDLGPIKVRNVHQIDVLRHIVFIWG